MVLLGKRIKELRNNFKLTQTELADMVGVTKSTIAAYENDTRLPSYDVLIKLADVFKVTIDSLLLNRSESTINISGLNPAQIDILESLIYYFRKNEMLDTICSLKSPSYELLIEKYPNMINKEKYELIRKMFTMGKISE